MRHAALLLATACGRIGFDPVATPDVDAAVTYHDINDPTQWSSFDLAILGATPSYAGAVFDGHYVYAVPFSNGLVLRYDPLLPFQDASSWSMFDIANVNARARSFFGGAFDGGFVYYVPDGNNVVARYDVSKAFNLATAWSFFDLTTITGTANYGGAVFDGRYLLFVPLNPPAVAIRYDTTAPFGMATSWQVITVASPSQGFLGGAFDGSALYLTPRFDGVVVRIDATNGFANPATFDIETLTQTFGFSGAVLDGTYVYFAETLDDSDGTVARYDSRLPFGAASSWLTYSTQPPGSTVGYLGATFDGRYAYFVPRIGLELARVDTNATFDATSSWSTVPLGSVVSLIPLASYAGAAFDGRFVYLMPLSGTVLARFDAKDAVSIPIGNAGSFF